jgi:hypothetical protein
MDDIHFKGGALEPGYANVLGKEPAEPAARGRGLENKRPHYHHPEDKFVSMKRRLARAWDAAAGLGLLTASRGRQAISLEAFGRRSGRKDSRKFLPNHSSSHVARRVRATSSPIIEPAAAR